MSISEQTCYRWQKLYAGLGVGEMLLEKENPKRKQQVADLSLNKHNLQDMLSKKL